MPLKRSDQGISYVAVTNEIYFDLFFREPQEGNPEGVGRSNLFILRRDLENLYGPEANLSDSEPKAPMLAAIGILSGIDLMAWITTWPKEPSRTDFIGFVQTFSGLKESEAEAIYQFRCAQVHSYGLYNVQFKTQKEFTFTLTTDHGAAIIAQPNNSPYFQIGFWALKKLFLDTIGSFKNKIETRGGEEQAELALKFFAATEKIGIIYVH